MTRTLLLTGATGTVSTALIDALGDTFHLRALTLDEDGAAGLRERGIETVTGDLGDPRTLPAAFEGVHDVWLLTPNGPRAAEQSMNAVWAARRAGVERVVRLSAVRASHDAPTRSERLHAMADEQLGASGLRWTIIRPLWFMQNLFNEAGDIAAGTVRLNMGDGRVGMVDARDIAEVAAKVLVSEPSEHHEKVYTLTGPEALSFHEAAERLGEALGRPVRYEPVADEVVEERMLGYGVPAWITDMVNEYAQAFVDGHGDFVTGDVEKVTGRAPRGLGEFVRDHSHVFG
ncbi:nucleotide-diphosphate-sugar epimerase [Actinorhabdospora filicis]|uniref:Nucleotide-diphosphate-sugar epimerase n=1 Tax=Actinorhabdospora filicis TaxID=1785913 RepID=A0A9W6SNC2_9ACTN|nr:SDR family oxidoreductase [Actinorhabdospora filicis]GLZ79383.1 nucleotide-diphosphate-sugar epimerase [Actinorhabdospora filicis]